MHQLRLKKTGTQTIDLRKASSIATYPRHNKQRKTRTTEEGRAEARGESGGHLDVIRLLDLGGGGVDADPQDIVVGAVLHHGRQLLDLTAGSSRSYMHQETGINASGNGGSRR